MIIYLAEGVNKYNGEWIKTLKIGHSGNFKSRGHSYDTDNGPNFTEEQIIGKKKGSKMLEKMLHLYLKRYSITKKSTGRRSEWCFYNKEIIKAFWKYDEKSLGILLWRNKEIYLEPQRKKKGKAKTVYDYLKSIFQTGLNSYNCNITKDNNKQNDKKVNREVSWKRAEEEQKRKEWHRNQD